jgi:allantoinase
VLAGDVDWICSDHACCQHEKKVDPKNPEDIFKAKSGFGGTEYLLSGVFTEGKKRGLSLGKMAQLLCKGPAERYALPAKGDIQVGMDADLVLFDPDKRFVVRADESPSAQGYTPFEGMELEGVVKSTYLRGSLIWNDGAIVGPPRGQFLRRPYDGSGIEAPR